MTPANARGGLICLGASAGGLRSLETILSRLPAEFPWPVLVSQHLQPDRASQMAAILARVASLAVREAVHGEVPVAGTVYTSPSDQELGVSIDGRLTLRPVASGRPQRIDHLFATASYASPGRIVAVVLSGTGSDGAMGSLLVKLNAGTVVTESDESAEHPDMAAAAHRAGTVDATRRAEDIAGLLDDLARGGLAEAASATEAAVAAIARDITTSGGTDFVHYRAATVRRQAEKRRALGGFRSLTEYHAALASDPQERAALVRSLLIPVTEFFRDPVAWRAVEDRIVPVLAARAREGLPVRVWCVGCATGEEAYSIAILLSESIVDRRQVHVLGTDLDPRAIEAAAEGVYDVTRMQGVDALRRERFFQAKEGAWQVDEELRKMVQFRVHDITREEPPGGFDLVLCRNLLIYFDEDLQERTVARLSAALTGPRLLFLGRSEALPETAAGFSTLVRSARLFEATGGSIALRPSRLLDEDEPAPAWPPSPDGEEIRLEEPDAIVLVVDEAWRITSANAHARGLVGRDLVGTSLLDLFPRWQGSPVHDALRVASETGRSLKVRGAPTPEGPMDVTLEPETGALRRILLIGTPTLEGRGEAHAMREDIAATNDELQSANEELAATNEELQATNEELASLNEEFQSTNQTLATTNVELGALAASAETATALMRELFQAWDEAIVACDAAHRVTFYNRRAADLLGIEASCIGRPLHLSLGASAGEVAVWLREAAAGPARGTLPRATGPLALGFRPVKGPSGSPLGWVVLLTAAP